MNRGNISKSIIILGIIIFAVILIIPTVGTKKMEIILKSDVSPQEIDIILNRFSADEYTVNRTQGKIEVEASGLSITDAVMNEVKTFSAAKNVKILPHWAEKAFLAKKINLGLDLQGGMRLVMMADFKKIKKKLINEINQLNKRKESLEKKLSRKGKVNKDKINEEIEGIESDLKDITDNKMADDELLERYKTEITQQALELLRNRIDKFGVSEPSIRPRGNEHIEIQLPGVKDPKSVKKAIGTTGSVEYRIVDDGFTLNAGNWLAKNYKEKRISDSTEGQYELLSEISKAVKLPLDLELLFLFKRDPNSKKIFPADIMALQRGVALAGSDIGKAWVGQDEYGGLTVQFRTTPEGAAKFAIVTGEKNRGKKLAIIIDDKIRSSPRINEPIVTGDASITGDFTSEEVNSLARIIQEGALPVDLNIVEERTVGPSLGQDSIDSGVKAIGIGLLGIMIFMIAYYKLLGIISVIGLILNTVFLAALLSWLGFTLTLPGIAGFILTVGMAVDANVIIYERIKEEIRNGKSVRMAVTNGFERAFWTITDANLTTLIAAFVLTQYGTGPVKGFGVTLCVGIVSSMFVALYITRFILETISMNKKVKKLSI